jgi:hypothetical protein
MDLSGHFAVYLIKAWEAWLSLTAEKRVDPYQGMAFSRAA